MTHTHHDTNPNRMAVSATLHCLTGCAIGEVLGMVIGTALGWSTVATTALAVFLAFVFGFGLSVIPLARKKIGVLAALSVVVAADTLSITVMEIVDNAVMILIPGALHSGLLNPIFWLSLLLALIAAFFAALPVNRYLLSKGRGHALLMRHHENHY